MVSLAQNFRRSAHPLGPKAVFSYGMTKCGSTLAFELARTALELSGYPQPVLPATATGNSRRINFAGHLDQSNIANLNDTIRDIGHPVVIKTHTRPDPCVIDMIDRGEAIVQATYRDPREMALSMIDHGNRSRDTGKLAFAEIANLDDALENITSQIDSLTQWLYRPNCLPIYYEDVAFRTIPTMRRILDQLQLDTSPGPIVRYVLRKRFIQLNKGIKKRFREEMQLKDQQRFQQEFRPFYRYLIRGRTGLPQSGEPVLPQSVILAPSLG